MNVAISHSESIAPGPAAVRPAAGPVLDRAPDPAAGSVRSAFGAGAGAQRVLLVGDSVLAGALVVDGPRIVKEVGTCVVDILRVKLPGVEFHVDAVPLRRVSDLVPVLPELLDRVRPTALVLALGGNDADIDWRRYFVSGGSRVRSNTPLDRYVESLAKIFSLASLRGVRTVLVEIIGSQMESRAGHFSEIAAKDLRPMIEESGGQGRVDEIVRMYRERAAEVARSHGVPIAPVGSCMDTHGERAVGPDGTHLNDHGHAVMADVLGRCLAGVLPAAIAP